LPTGAERHCNTEHSLLSYGRALWAVPTTYELTNPPPLCKRTTRIAPEATRLRSDIHQTAVGREPSHKARCRPSVAVPSGPPAVRTSLSPPDLIRFAPRLFRYPRPGRPAPPTQPSLVETGATVPARRRQLLRRLRASAHELPAYGIRSPQLSHQSAATRGFRSGW